MSNPNDYRPWVTLAEFRMLAAPSGSYDEPVSQVIGGSTSYKSGVPSAKINFELTSSCQQIDSALRSHHTIPLSGLDPSRVPNFLKKLAINLTQYELNPYKGNKPQEDNPLELSYKNALDFLTRLRNGQEHIDQVDDQIDSTPDKEGRIRCGTISNGIRIFNTNSQGITDEIV